VNQTLTDLGPANTSMFPLMSALQLGTLLHIGSRNLTPSMAITYDVAARRVVARHDFGPGKFVQALAARPGDTGDGATIYAGLVGCDDHEPNIHAFPSTPAGPTDGDSVDTTPGRPVATIPGVGVRVLACAPDGTLYAAGKEDAPAVWQVTDGTEVRPRRLAVPDPTTTQCRGLAADEEYVYFGCGSNLAGGHGAGLTRVFRVHRDTGATEDLTPDELRADPAVRQLHRVGRRLLVGTQGLGRRSHLAVIDLDTGRTLRVWELPGKSVGCFAAGPDGTVLLAAATLHRVDPERLELSDGPTTSAGERWGLGHHGDEVLTVSAMGQVVHSSDRGDERVRLVEVGAPALPQLGMSLQVTDGRLYVGGNGGVVVHELATAPWGPDMRDKRLEVPGEAKTITCVDDVAHLAVYSSQGLWTHDPGTGALGRAVEVPAEFNRPQDSCWDDEGRRLLVGYQNDTQGGGALVVWTPGSGDLLVHTNPFDEYQMVRAVTSRDGDAWLGGWNRYEQGPRGTVARVDPGTAAIRWRQDGAGAGISCLGLHGPYLWAITMTGEALAFDARSGEPCGRQDLSHQLEGMTRIVETPAGVVVGSADTVLRLSSPDRGPELIVTGLDGQWYSGPKIAQDSAGRLYTLRGRHVVRIAAPHAVDGRRD